MSDSRSVAVIGNPNCGKTTLFNGLTGSSQHIGNWPGVTVDEKRGKLLGHAEVEIVDLPGIYSLNATSEDERIARDRVLAGDFDLMVNIVDASNMERNLFLTLTLLELGKPMILLLNMMDLAGRRGLTIDVAGLEADLGVPVLGINALDGRDIRDVRRAIGESLESPRIPRARVTYPESMERYLQDWSARLGEASRPRSLMLLEEDDDLIAEAVASGQFSREEIIAGHDAIEAELGETPDIVIADAKYSFINRLVDSRVKRRSGGKSRSEKIDRVVLSSWLGVPLFLAVIFLLFWIVMNIGGAFIDFFDILFGAVFVEGFGRLLTGVGAPDWLRVLLADGVGGGIQTVATFIPIIFTMFFMLSLLEDSGYMSRASFVMDRFMRTLGLPGKAFVPMLVGFGCTVPAVMATRTLEDRKDRYLTVFLAPFMSCGARLPVYALFGAAFFGPRAGIAVVSLYVTGILMAVVTAFLLKNTLFKGEVSHFAMELPPYHAPRMREIMKRTWARLQDFILRAGQVIVIAVLLLSFLNSLGTDGSFGNEDGEKSVLAGIARVITPVFEPMGIEEDNWPATVGLMTGIFAKEAIVGTMNSLYGQIAAAESGEDPEGEFSLARSAGEAIRSIPESFRSIFGSQADPMESGIVSEEATAAAEQIISTDTGTFAALRASFSNDWRRGYAYLLFVLLYFPCVAALGAMIQEIGVKFGVLAVTYLTVLAWSVATLFFQITQGHSVFWMIFAVVLVALFIPVFNMISGRSDLPWKTQKNN